MKRIREYQYGGVRGYNTSPYGGFGLSHAPFVPQYTGAPIEDVQKVGEGLTEAYYTSLAEATKLDMLNQEMQSAAGDKPELAKLQGYYSDEIKKLADAGNWEDLYPKVNRLASRWVGDPVRKALQQTHQEFQKIKDLNLQRALKGDPPLEFTVDERNYQTVRTDPKTGETLIQPYTSQAEAWRNVQPEMTRFFDQILPNITESILQRTKNTPIGMLERSQLENITVERLNDYLQGTGDQYAGSPGAWESFKNTDAYRFRMKQELWDPETQTFSDDPDDKILAEEKIYNELLGTGTERVFKKFGRDYSVDPTFNKDTNKNLGYSFTQGTQAGNNDLWKESDYDVSFNEKTGNIDIGKRGIGDLIGDRAQERILVDPSATWAAGIPQEINAPKAREILIAEGVNPGPDPQQQLQEYIETSEKQVSQTALAAASAGISSTGAAVAAEQAKSLWRTSFEDKYGVEFSTKVPEETKKEIQAVQAFVLDQYPTLKDNPKEANRKTVEIMNSMNKNMRNVTTKYWQPPTGSQTYSGNQVDKAIGAGNIPGKNVALVMPNHGGSYRNLNGWDGIRARIEQEISDRGGDPESMNFSFTWTGNAKGNPYDIPFAERIQVTVTDKENRPFTFELYTEPPEEVQDLFRPLQDVYNLMYSGDIGEHIVEVPAALGSAVKVKVVPWEKSSGQWQSSAYIQLSSNVLEILNQPPTETQDTGVSSLFRAPGLEGRIENGNMSLADFADLYKEIYQPFIDMYYMSRTKD